MDAIKTIGKRCEPATPGPAKRMYGVGLRSALEWINAALSKRRSRLALYDLTDDQLRDIGISREEARREGLRSFWS
ncbi:DUF1127 domain-containing protein [Nitratireductor sp. B36]|uniref:DUF1127 domain-containing protein n=1 Tax=Nitratireductor sp. B36 TaxID=2762059 RepID=UPI001E461104|nr:DUF1127 domain-containing protein [Nitratireductor sp. B36]MCC5777733.1 DUF1127 domain-containing protein [Nitratireductor sp. B36]